MHRNLINKEKDNESILGDQLKLKYRKRHFFGLIEHACIVRNNVVLCLEMWWRTEGCDKSYISSL